MSIKKATRTGIKPFIALYSESGCGKTYSSLILARGLAGPKGKIVMADSENGRGSLYADVSEIGGYDTVEIGEPFSPQNFIATIDEVEASGADVGILDSGSHEWNGVGGILDMAAESESRSGKGLHNWKGPKFEHAKFVQRLMRSKIPWIVCLRAKYLTRQTKDEKGKTVIIKDDHTSPVQADDFIFECTCHGEILTDHSLRLTKWSHPDLKKCFPDGGPITLRHGELIAKWCVGAVSSQTPAQSPEEKAFKSKLWKITEHIHKGDPAALESYLVSGNFLEPGISLSSITGAKLKTICAQVEEELGATK